MEEKNKKVKKEKKEKKEKIKKKKFGRVPPVVILSYIFVFIILLLFAYIYYVVTNDVYNKDESDKNINKYQSFDYCGDLVLHMVDVGQGEAIIVELPSKQLMLVDSGPKDCADKLIDYIKSHFDTDIIDYVLLTHPDVDHIGGMSRVFDEFYVRYVFRPYIRYDTSGNTNQDVILSGLNKGVIPVDFDTQDLYYEFLCDLANEGCGYEFFNKDSDITFELNQDGKKSTFKLDFLTPTVKVDNIDYSYSNEFSPLVMLDFNGYKIMLTGDASKSVENEFLSYYKDEFLDFDVDILKVAHHGSNTSSSQDFLKFIQPNYSLISCGENNAYQHPHQETLDNLFECAQSVVLRTDIYGNIVLRINSQRELKIELEKNSDKLF